jgi:hypothetical protein
MPTTTSPLAKKLQLRPGHKIALVNAPRDIAEKLRPLPEHATVTTASAPRDAVIAFANDQAGLGKVATHAIKALKPDGLLWLAYPKGTPKVKTDLNRECSGRSSRSGTASKERRSWRSIRPGQRCGFGREARERPELDEAPVARLVGLRADEREDVRRALHARESAVEDHLGDARRNP